VAPKHIWAAFCGVRFTFLKFGPVICSFFDVKAVLSPFQDSKTHFTKAKLALNMKWVMASPFGITRQILLLLQGWFVRLMSPTTFVWGKTITYPGFKPGTFGLQVGNVTNWSHGGRYNIFKNLKWKKFMRKKLQLINRNVVSYVS
jgi:hypothetical protein